MIIVRVKKHFPGGFDLDMSLRFGPEFVAVTGHNGSGKTSLLRMVAGLDRPDDGAIVSMGTTFYDKKIWLAPDKRNVGYVFQDAALFPWLTVEKNIEFGLKHSNRNARHENTALWLEELYDALNVKHLLGRYPEKLSGGEAQRVAIVRALAPCPDMLLLDEPFSAIDMEQRPAVRAFIQKMQRRWEIPVLLVTHDNAEIHTLADRIFRLENGRVKSTSRRSEFASMPGISY